MAATIRIDPDIEEYFQMHGKFGESHSDVLRRCLKDFPPTNQAEDAAPKKKRLSRGLATPQKKFKDFILIVLVEDLGGKASSQQVLDRIEERFGETFNSYDFMPLDSSGEIRWKKSANFARQTLVNDRLLLPKEESGYDSWELSAKGREYYAKNLKP